MELYELIYYVLKNIVKSKRLRKHLRRVIASKIIPAETPAREIALLVTTLDDEKLLLSKKNEFPPIREIRKSLWRTRSQLLDWVDYTKVASGRYTPETKAALNRIIGRWGSECLTLLQYLRNSPETQHGMRKLAEYWIKKFNGNT